MSMFLFIELYFCYISATVLPKLNATPRFEGENDLEVLSSLHDLNVIDPVTKKIMTKAVRNSKCGHVYDKASILTMIKQSGKKGFRSVVVDWQSDLAFLFRSLQYLLFIEMLSDKPTLPNSRLLF